MIERTESDRLVDSLLARPPRTLPFQLLHPDPPAARAAAERVVAVAWHLDELAADRVEHAARRVVHPVVAAERARVVVGDAVAELLCRPERALLEQLEQELRVVEHRPDAAVERVLVPQRVERVGVGGEDPFELARRDGAHVLLGEIAPEALLARAAHVAAGGLLRVEEDSEVGAGTLEDACERLGRPLVARVEGRVVAHEPEQFGRLLANVLDLERKLPRPARTLALRLAERVAGL